MTPDPIRLLAAAHEPDPHDNVARDSWRNGQTDGNAALGSDGGTVMVIYSREMNSILIN